MHFYESKRAAASADGAYADASYHSDGSGSVAVVLIAGGVVIHRIVQRLNFLGSEDAEVDAVDLAKSLYPDVEIFTDSVYASRACGAVWIPREMNRIAHHMASRAYRGLPLGGEPITKEMRADLRRRGKKKNQGLRCRTIGRWKGCGVVSAS